MFVKKDEVLKVQTLIEDIVEKLRMQNIELAKLKDAQDELTQELDDSRHSIEQLKDSLVLASQTAESGAKQINNEVVELKMFLSQVKRDLVSELSSDFSREMKSLTGGIMQDLDSFRRLKERFSAIDSDASKMREEIIKFLSISEKIKQADFDLERYARTIQQGDKEKLELLRRIDTLERLVSKLRKST